MKKKTTQDGRTYFFSKDIQIETLASKIILLLKEVKHNPTMTQKEKLEEARDLYIEYNLFDDKAMRFNRPIVLGHSETEEERVRHWTTEAIKAILKAIDNRETKLNADFINHKSNGKGVDIYKHSNGTFVIKSIFSPYSILVSSLDYTKLDEIVNKEWNMGIKDLTGQEFYQLCYDLRTINRATILKLLPSYGSGYLPDNYKHPSLEQVMGETKLLTSLSRLKQKDKRIDNSSSTMDVFDIGDDF